MGTICCSKNLKKTNSLRASVIEEKSPQNVEINENDKKNKKKRKY